jgi:hypothetical protein
VGVFAGDMNGKYFKPSASARDLRMPFAEKITEPIAIPREKSYNRIVKALIQ